MGKLNGLEVAGVGPKATNYVWIDIGGATLYRKIVATELNKHLQAALKAQGKITIWFSDNIVVGVRLPSGETYISRYRFGIGDWMLVGAGVLMIPVGIGLLFLALGAKSAFKLSSLNKQAKLAVSDSQAVALPAFT